MRLRGEVCLSVYVYASLCVYARVWARVYLCIFVRFYLFFFVCVCAIVCVRSCVRKHPQSSGARGQERCKFLSDGATRPPCVFFLQLHSGKTPWNFEQGYC